MNNTYIAVNQRITTPPCGQSGHVYGISEEKGGRTLYLDITRILACSMVLLNHSLVGGDTNMMIKFLTHLLAPCNALFFMVSGALLFGKKQRYSVFIKKRLSRVIVPLFIWSFLYYVLSPTLNILHLFWIPFTNIHIYFWFIYALIGCYLVIPIVEPWLESASKREVQQVLFLWLIIASLPIITEAMGIPSFDERSAFYYFGGFLGFFILGRYIEKYDISWKEILSAACLGIMLMAVRYVQSLFHIYENSFIQPFTIPYGFAIMASIKKISTISISDKLKSLIGHLSSCTFGMYLIHALILSYLKRAQFLDSMPLYVDIFVRWVITMILAYGIITTLKRFKYSKFFVG